MPDYRAHHYRRSPIFTKHRCDAVRRFKLRQRKNSELRSTPRASAREDLRRNFCAAANFKYQRGYRSRNSGVRSCRSCRIREQGLYPKIQDQHLPGKILAKLPDSLAPELLQLLTPEFRNVLGGQAQVSEKLQELQEFRGWIRKMPAEGDE